MFKCDGFNGTIVLSMWPFHIGGSVKNFLKAVAWPPVVLKLNVTTASRFWGGGMGYWVAAISVWNASSTHHRSKPNLHHLGEDHLATWRRREWCTSCPPPPQSHSPFFHPRLKTHLFKKYLTLPHNHLPSPLPLPPMWSRQKRKSFLPPPLYFFSSYHLLPPILFSSPVSGIINLR